ncbi:MAG: outer membrane protein transport protein [Thermoanaerobaculum sp.]|nr:outer membrane protein transport protein [Thermoanaerobaculum sp.]
MTMARKCRWLMPVGLCLLLPALAFGNGFALFEHGARGVSMGGAFAAVADDVSAGYYNPAGLAFLEGTKAMAGVFLITQSSKFRGDNPYPGAGYKTEMEDQIFYPPHFHYSAPLAGNFRYGLSLLAPFGLGTWWPDNYAGRFISKRIDLKLIDVNPHLAWKLSDALAVGAGFNYFLAQVDLTKSIGVVNPYTQRVAEVGQVHMFNKDWATGWGYNVGVLWRLGGGFALGAAYRSRVLVEVNNARASFVQFATGYADFDALVAQQIPFHTNPKGKTRINFPAEARLGLAWKGERTTFSFDAVHMGWDSFQELPITIVGYPALSSVRPENFRDAWTYRFGFERKLSDRLAVQLGYLRDLTPMPTHIVSPMLPDADRNGFSVGFSWQMNEKMRVDGSFLHLPFDERSTKGLNIDNYNGTYRTRAALFGMSVVYSF